MERMRNQMPDQLMKYPVNRVVGIIAEPEKVQAALNALSSSGFDVNTVDVLCGEEGAQQLNGPDTRHSRLRGLLQTVHTLGKGRGYVSQYEQALLAGHFLLSVPVRGPGAKSQIRALLKNHGGYFITFYGRRAVEPLEA